MLSESLYKQCLCHAIGEYLGAWNLFDGKLSFVDKLSDVVVLYINVFSTVLTLYILNQRYAHLVVAM